MAKRKVGRSPGASESGDEPPPGADDPRGEMVDAFLQHELMEEAAAYLRRGRRFATLPSDELRARWVAAFKELRTRGSEACKQEISDLEAELRMRGIDPPFDAVRDELEAARAEIRAEGPHNPFVREKIRQFLKKMDDPDA